MKLPRRFYVSCVKRKGGIKGKRGWSFVGKHLQVPQITARCSENEWDPRIDIMRHLYCSMDRKTRMRLMLSHKILIWVLVDKIGRGSYSCGAQRSGRSCCLEMWMKLNLDSVVSNLSIARRVAGPWRLREDRVSAASLPGSSSSSSSGRSGAPDMKRGRLQWRGQQHPWRLAADTHLLYVISQRREWVGGGITGLLVAVALPKPRRAEPLSLKVKFKALALKTSTTVSPSFFLSDCKKRRCFSSRGSSFWCHEEFSFNRMVRVRTGACAWRCTVAFVQQIRTGRANYCRICW